MTSRWEQMSAEEKQATVIRTQLEQAERDAQLLTARQREEAANQMWTLALARDDDGPARTR